MTVYVLKLSNDEELIAKFEHVLNNETDQYVAIDPMSIIGMRDDSYGSSGMRLRNAMVMSDSDTLILRGRFVMSWYEPSVAMLAYYNAAVAYNKNFSKKAVDSQITNAAEDLQKHADLSQSVGPNGPLDDTAGSHQSLDDMMEEFNKIMGNIPRNNRKLQ
jgi:hypothetical protein